MATFSMIAHNAFQAIGLARPRFEVIVREPADYSEEKQLRMQWVREMDAHGRRVMRLRWVEDNGHKLEIVSRNMKAASR